MENEVYSAALKNTLKDIADTYQDIRSIFLMKEKGDIISVENESSEETVVHTAQLFDDILSKGEVLGGIDNISVQAEHGTIEVKRINDFYIVTVLSERADLTYVIALISVLFSNVLRLLDKFSPTLDLSNSNSAQGELARTRLANNPLQEATEKTTKRLEEDLELIPDEASHSPHVNQFIVHNFEGFFKPKDTVQVDRAILTKWAELYEDRSIEEATVESFAGKSLRCKIKMLKDSKLEGKGIIQIPEKLQAELDVRKGQLVKVKPIIE